MKGSEAMTLFYTSWLSPELVDSLSKRIDGDNLIEFGYCPRDKEFTPIFYGYTHGRGVICGLCSLSSDVYEGQNYPEYSARSKMRARRVEKLVALGLDTIDGQRKWLSKRLLDQHEKVEQDMRQLMENVRELADEKRNLAEAIRRIK